MCGIGGFLLENGKASVEDVRAMTDLIRHRGPDNDGIYTDGACVVGMRGVSIIDLYTGHQPLSNEDGSIWVVFNGEIYNYKELRNELLGRGHRFAIGISHSKAFRRVFGIAPLGVGEVLSPRERLRLGHLPQRPRNPLSGTS